MDILLIEDNADLADTLKAGLEHEGYRVEVVHDGVMGEARARSGTYDLLIVDWMLPGRDGPAILHNLRRDGLAVPALLLTARAEQADELRGLDAGADDYVTKPFSFDVLLARVRALVRRSRAARDPAPEAIRVEAGPLWIDVRERTAGLGEQELTLREKEFQILVLLASHPNHLFTRRQVADQVWGGVYASDDTLNTTVHRLRRALQDAAGTSGEAADGVSEAGAGVTLETVRGVGYRLLVEA